MSDLPVQPLQGQFRIADPETGLPTQEFLQWTKAVTDLLPTQEEALAAIEGAGLTALSGRIALGNNTRFGDEIEIDADTQAILDVISNVRGSILYRGASGWASLAPGPAGQILRTAGAGADPSWAAAGGGGGGATLIAELTAPTAGEFDFTSLDLSSYNQVELEFVDLQFSTTGRPGLKFYIGSTLTTNQVYFASVSRLASGGTETNNGQTGAEVALLDNTSSSWWVVDTGTDANAVYNGRFRIWNPNSNHHRQFEFNGGSSRGNSGTPNNTRGGGAIWATGTLDGFQVTSLSGTISAGTVRVWGY